MDVDKEVEFRIKHLEMIQATIARMNHNSFLVKGWAITLFAAMFAFGVKTTPATLIAIFPAMMGFWLLDSYYLWIEKQFRALHIIVAYSTINITFELAPFEMDATGLYRAGKIKSETFFKIVRSETVATLYVVLSIVVVLAMFILSRVPGK